VITVVPIIYWSMDFPDDNVVVLVVVVFDQASFNTGQKTGGRITVKAYHIFPKKRNLIV
jgi:hypothetical protein